VEKASLTLEAGKSGQGEDVGFKLDIVTEVPAQSNENRGLRAYRSL
jgi:hypothetical protein